MKKLLCLLMLLLTLTSCTAERTVLALYLTDQTLPVEARDYGVETFLALCPEADPATTSNITPVPAFTQYDMRASVFADASGAAWFKSGPEVFRLTDAPSQRVTSLCPALTAYGTEPVLLYTRQDTDRTEVCLFDPETGSQRVLLTTDEPLVLLWRDPLFSYNPLQSFDHVLLCTAEITQPDPAAPALSCHLLEVAGDVRLESGEFVADLRAFWRYAIVSDAQALSALDAFAAHYRLSHIITDISHLSHTQQGGAASIDALRPVSAFMPAWLSTRGPPSMRPWAPGSGRLPSGAPPPMSSAFPRRWPVRAPSASALPENRYRGTPGSARSGESPREITHFRAAQSGENSAAPPHRRHSHRR